MSILDQKNLRDAFHESSSYQLQFFRPFEEYERLARNKPSPKIPKNLPKTTDGTLAGIIREQPRRVIQQIPTGVVRGPEDELAEMAGYALTERILPLSNSQGSVIQKSWVMLEKALTYGAQPSYSFFTNTNDRFHTDFSLPYIRDVIVEKGKNFAPDSNFQFLVSWWSKYDIDALIRKEERLIDKDKSYKPTWNLKKLKKLRDLQPETNREDPPPAEREKGNPSSPIKIIHAFQKGVGEKFYSFSPHMEGSLRAWTNEDPRGKSPINWLYADIDLSNPYGRGMVELIGGLQNLLDFQTQMFQYISTMMMGPPLQKWGNVNDATLKYEPNVIWDMGTSQNNHVEPFNVSNQSITNFPANYGLIKSQLLNMSSSLDSSVSAESGNPGFSKTPAGIEQNQVRLSISDNYLRKQYEEWFSNMAETSLNLFFAKMEGKEELEIPPQRLSKLTPETLKKYQDKKTKKIEIPYGDLNDIAFKFEVDASSSEVKSGKDNADKATELLRISQNVMTDEQKYKMIRLIGKEIGFENVDKIFPDIDSSAGQEEERKLEEQTEIQKGREAALAGQQIANQPQSQPQTIETGQPLGEAMTPGLAASPAVAPQAPPPQQEVPQEAQEELSDEEFLTQLSQVLGEEELAQVQVLLEGGASKDEILEGLEAIMEA